MAPKSRAGKKQPQRRGGSRPTVRRVVAPPAARTPVPIPETSQLFLPRPGSSYPEVLRHEGYAWWRSVLGVVIALILYVFVIQLVAQVVVGIGWLIAGRSGPFAEFYAAAARFERPVGMLGANLGIAGLVLVTFVVMVIFNRTRPGWVASVEGRPRWRYLLVCFPVALAVFAVVLALGAVLEPTGGLDPQDGVVGFLIVIVLTSPLQAAAEEVFFRGYLMQALGSLVANPWFGVVVSATVFALLHGATQSPALFLNRFGFGLLAAVLVLKTGGIEAGIALHVVNNWLAFGAAALTTSVAEARGLTDVTWTQTWLNLGGFAAFAVVAYLIARRWRLRTTVGEDNGLSEPRAVQ